MSGTEHDAGGGTGTDRAPQAPLYPMDSFLPNGAPTHADFLAGKRRSVCVGCVFKVPGFGPASFGRTMPILRWTKLQAAIRVGRASHFPPPVQTTAA